jgi:hypothetical protein
MTESSGLHAERAFTGTLSCDANRADISFKARVDERGELILALDEIPLNDETKFILVSSNDEPSAYFSLLGLSADGTRFSSAHLFFSQIGTPSDYTGTRLALKGRCAAAEFVVPVNDSPTPQFLMWLRGFESFGVLATESPIGTVSIVGGDGSRDIALVSGGLSIKAPDTPADLKEWQATAKDLAEHVRGVMSCAASTRLSCPTTEFRFGPVAQVVVTSTTQQHPGQMPVFHYLDRQAIFETAVKSFFIPPIPVANLWMTLDWFVMHATYNEMRLLCAMTALENLISSNLPKKDKLLLKDSVFGKLRPRLRTQIEAFLIESGLGAASPELATELVPKLSELQRASLKYKLRLMISRWSIPMDGLSIENVDAAISARNLIVHEGAYYKAGAQQTELWTHVTAVREMVIRAILTAIGFRGRYISHWGGLHDATFPPSADPGR